MADLSAITSIASGANPLQRLQQLSENPATLNRVGNDSGMKGIQSAFPEYLQAARESVGVRGLSASQAVGPVGGMQGMEAASSLGAHVGSAVRPVSFGEAVEQLIEGVDTTQKAAGAEVRKVLTGESDNLHQAMIAMQESSLAFTMMVEVRNKLTDALQEVMRMQV